MLESQLFRVLAVNPHAITRADSLLVSIRHGPTTQQAYK